MTGLLSLVLPALVPVLADGVRGLIARVTQGAGAQPANVGEAIQLMEAQTARLQALAEMDKLAPNASPWVADLRGAFRYVAVAIIITATLGAVLFAADQVPEPVQLVLLDLSGACMSFIIGERMYIGLRK